MKKLAWPAALLAVLCAVASGIDGKNGYSSTQLFQWGEIRASIQYDAGFTGVKWEDMASSALSGALIMSDAVGASADGIFYLANGSDQIDTEYTGLIVYDGTNHRQLMYAEFVRVDVEGESLRCMRMSPSSAGRLTSGWPVVMRWNIVEWGTELMSVNPTTGAATVVHLYPASPAGDDMPERFAIGADGRIFALYQADDAISVLTWNGTGYTETDLNTSVGVDGPLRVGSDGFVYTFNAAQGMWFNGSGGDDKQILRINPDSGASSIYGYVKSRELVSDWAFDSAGTLWVSLIASKKGGRYISSVPAGGVTSSRAAVSSSSARMLSFAGGPEASDGSAGPFYVLESPGDNGVGSPSDEMWQLTPTSGGGDGGGGNGGGGGRGKPKK